MMNEEREQIMMRVSMLSRRSRSAALPRYDSEMVVQRAMLAGRDRVELLAERMQRVNGQLFTDGHALVAHLRAQGWKHGYCDPVLWPALAAHFQGFTVELEFDRTRVDDYAFGITRAAGAIAESGTIVLNDTTTSRRLAALAPWVHVAVVERATIFLDVPAAIAGLGPDRNVIWCTGPRRPPMSRAS